MIQLKNKEQIAIMREAGRITGEAILKAGEAVREGVTTKHLDDIVRRHIEKCGAVPACLGYEGFPASACVSVNDEIIHGIPSPHRVLHEGDIVKIDTCACYHGFIGDCANTFPVGQVSKEAERLIQAAKDAFFKGLMQLSEGKRLGDIGSAIEEHVRSCGFTVLRDYTGHGVGREMHEDPNVPNYGTPGRGQRLLAGMTIAIEPMVCAGSNQVRVLPNNWTVQTVDGGLTAHFEHTVALTPDGVVILTEVG